MLTPKFDIKIESKMLKKNQQIQITGGNHNIRWEENM